MIDTISKRFESFSLNTVVSGFMEYTNALVKLNQAEGGIDTGTLEDAVLMLAPFAPLQTFIMALLIQARHLFYGISMLDKYKDVGWKKLYLIFAMCDESFSINYTADIPEDVDRGWFYFWVSLLNQSYWVSGALVGGLAGSLLKFNTEGLDFVMTAMFVVIFMEQWMKQKKHHTGLIGIGCTALCLYFFGSTSFMVPAMIMILAILLIFRKPLEEGGLE
jgi:4-azaleucine resistance transporter AzlC